MFEEARAAQWHKKFIQPALRQVMVSFPQAAVEADALLVVEFWLWAVLFRFSPEYVSLSVNSREKARAAAFKWSLHFYKNAQSEQLLGFAKDIVPQRGLSSYNLAVRLLEQTLRPTFEHAIVAATKLAPLHEHFEIAALRRLLSEVHPSFLHPPGISDGPTRRDLQVAMKSIARMAAVGQAVLYAWLTGILIPADKVLIEESDIPDLIDVFVSYGRPDRPLVADIVSKFQNAHIAAWFDQRLEPDVQFDRYLNDQIEAAKLVLTVWSQNSIHSKWVRAESLLGFNDDKLLQIRIGACDIPAPFNIMHTIETPTSGLDDGSFAVLFETVKRRIGLAEAKP